MSQQGNQFSQSIDDFSNLRAREHVAFLFSSLPEKQSKLFSLVSSILEAGTNSILYLAGKQGVKGIRLSMKDAGINVALYERRMMLKIEDSQEWYLDTGISQGLFRSDSEIESRFRNFAESLIPAGPEAITIISEMDILVRKGFLEDCIRFERTLNLVISSLNALCVCVYDERDLSVQGIPSPQDRLAHLHNRILR
jgi:hypothetical protein